MSEGMPGWSEFQSAISQLESVVGGGGSGGIRAEDGSIVNPNFYSGGSHGRGGGLGAGGRPIGIGPGGKPVDPIDEAYMNQKTVTLMPGSRGARPGDRVVGIGRGGKILDPIDEAYQAIGYKVLSPSEIAKRQGHGGGYATPPR